MAEHEDRTIEVLRNPEDVQGAARRWERKGWDVVHASSGSWSGSVRLHLQRPVTKDRRTTR